MERLNKLPSPEQPHQEEGLNRSLNPIAQLSSSSSVETPTSLLQKEIQSLEKELETLKEQLKELKQARKEVRREVAELMQTCSDEKHCKPSGEALCAECSHLKKELDELSQRHELNLAGLKDTAMRAQRKLSFNVQRLSHLESTQ